MAALGCQPVVAIGLRDGRRQRAREKPQVVTPDRALADADAALVAGGGRQRRRTS
jgi:hypothetical protein